MQDRKFGDARARVREVELISDCAGATAQNGALASSPAVPVSREANHLPSTTLQNPGCAACQRHARRPVRLRVERAARPWFPQPAGNMLAKRALTRSVPSENSGCTARSGLRCALLMHPAGRRMQRAGRPFHPRQTDRKNVIRHSSFVIRHSSFATRLSRATPRSLRATCGFLPRRDFCR